MTVSAVLDRPSTATSTAVETTTAAPVTGWWPDHAKRGFDLVATLLGLLVLLPLIAAIALAIALQDGGPVLFRQTRVGRRGTLFTIYKFRSMVVDAEALKPELLGANEGAHHLFKIRSDPRITPLGRVLRRLSLDELPQLLNVLNGTMSLVGPRPHLPAEVAWMPPAARRRAEVRPGLTGLWQVSGRSDLDEDQSVRLDLAYVDRCSPALDASILGRTVGAVLSGRGAA
ncbi:sugar transferase [uncultured Friedmanniella sp.]|uniref:sugar transferase n=1 Tax=uncultured Friedmanniella sp. TaxID=335381 RepID=UPI0035CABE3D